jgi:hypothetical protein
MSDPTTPDPAHPARGPEPTPPNSAEDPKAAESSQQSDLKPTDPEVTSHEADPRPGDRADAKRAGNAADATTDAEADTAGSSVDTTELPAVYTDTPPRSGSEGSSSAATSTHSRAEDVVSGESSALSVSFGMSWRRSKVRRQPLKQAAEKPTASFSGDTPNAQKTTADKAIGSQVGPAEAANAKKSAEAPKKSLWRRVRVRGPWLTVAGVVVVLVVLALLGYEWGLGPLNRLNTNRGITPPAKLSGLDRITDSDIRGQLQLDETRDALRRINDGKKATVEAYGTVDGNRLFVIIALRGKVDIDKTVADSGATPDKVKKVGSSTCVESTGTLPTQCYRGSNTLTVIAQSANEGVTVDQVAPVADEAFTTMK